MKSLRILYQQYLTLLCMYICAKQIHTISVSLLQMKVGVDLLCSLQVALIYIHISKFIPGAWNIFGEKVLLFRVQLHIICFNGFIITLRRVVHIFSAPLKIHIRIIAFVPFRKLCTFCYRKNVKQNVLWNK